jgi:hypothetical protein
MIVGESIVVLKKPMFNKDFKCEKHNDVYYGVVKNLGEILYNFFINV